ncbi:zinc fingers and homeoboxes protein 3 [Microcaecilia unicolor]|uniref:Zinc fingers and homeoboxes protein 3 n=1 Tax=Microcaecilia unicolor TaxID=1415580 RepID=A0A6P7YQ10_9AMPH|nr:zinc fingers and homeoboxes protein 3 [Microcaecilia unicolor]XP_030067084.1 zinc fingers and homeoboxes protein 3 [Microcaecilia unicolor]
MASKRKSTTPCMIPLKTMVLEETDTDLVENYNKRTQQETHTELLTVGDTTKTTSITTAANNVALSNGYQSIIDGGIYVCKYCAFSCRDISKFVNHMNSEHLDFSRDPSYVCVECSFLVKNHDELKRHNALCHSGETSFIWNVAKHDNHITVEQSISDTTSSQGFSGDSNEDGVDGQYEITITKTPIMKIMKSKMETKKIHTVKENMIESSTYPSVNEMERKRDNYVDTNESALVNQSSVSSMNSSQIITSSMIGTVPILQSGVAQIVSVQQQPSIQPIPTSECLPKVMIPLSSIPTYNAAMDSNSFLKNSFNKFPYPTKAELCYLTVVTKYPEEQIKIWFTAQRLKQGISWSPEEIEDARKKMFNTVFQSVSQPAFAVLNAPLIANAGSVQQLIHTGVPGQFVGQPKETGRLLVSQPVIANGVQGASSSLALAVSSVPKKRAPSQPSILSANVKVVNTAPSSLTACPNISSQHYVDPNLYKNKKSHEQLSALKSSFCKSQFPAHSEVERLTRVTGLAKRDVRKWFSDRRYHYRNYKGTRSFFARHNAAIDSQQNVTFSTPSKGPEHAYTPPATTQSAPHTRRQSWHQAPDFTPTKYKERAPEQVKALEDSFAQNSFPSEEEVDRLRSETKMTRREIDSWFSDKRKKIAEEEKKEEGAGLEDEDDEENDEDVESSDELRIEEENGSFSELDSNHAALERKVSPIKINLKNLRVTESSDKGESQGDNVDSQEYDESNRLSIPQKDKIHFKKTMEQRHFLKKFFVQSQWPTNQEYDSLAEQLGLQRHELVRWFGDSRYCFKNGHLKWFETYKRGIYPPYLVDTSANSHPVLEDYFGKYNMLCDDDIESLCEKTQMTEEEVKMWFAIKTEESRAASDAGSEDQHSMFDDQPGSQKGANDSYSEVSENSESWKPSTQESCLDSFGTFTQQSRIELEAD